MKKIIFLAAAGIILSQAPAYADNISVYLNNNAIDFDQPPIIYNDLTYVPFRAIFESFGMVVQWNDDEKRATAYNQNYNVSFLEGYDYIFLNGIGTPIPYGPLIYNSRMLVPLRALVEGIDGKIYWDGNTSSVYIYSDSAVDDSSWEYDVLTLTNQIRTSYGLGTLTWDSGLSEVGREHCMDMAAREYFAHDTPEGVSPFDRMHNANIWPIYAGENIAAGQINPQAVVTDWMNSPEHRDNILTPEYTHMGASMYRGGNLGIYWAQEFASYGN